MAVRAHHFALCDFGEQSTDAPEVDQLADDHALVAIDMVEVHDVVRVLETAVSTGSRLRLSRYLTQSSALAVLLVERELPVLSVPLALHGPLARGVLVGHHNPSSELIAPALSHDDGARLICTYDW